MATPSAHGGDYLLDLLHNSASQCSSSSDDACRSSSCSSSFSRGSSLDANTGFMRSDDSFVDPAVAALGPSHPLSRFEGTGNVQLQDLACPPRFETISNGILPNSDRQHHTPPGPIGLETFANLQLSDVQHHQPKLHHSREHHLGWSVHQHPPPDLRLFEQSSADSPFQPNLASAFQPPPHFYAQYPGSLTVVDYNAYNHHAPSFLPSPGFVDNQAIHEPPYQNSVEPAMSDLTRQSSVQLLDVGTFHSGDSNQLKMKSPHLLSSHVECLSLPGEKADIGLNFSMQYGPAHLKSCLEPVTISGVEDGLIKDLDRNSGSPFPNDTSQRHMRLQSCISDASECAELEGLKDITLPSADWGQWLDLVNGGPSQLPTCQQEENFENDVQNADESLTKSPKDEGSIAKNHARHKKLSGSQRPYAHSKGVLNDISEHKIVTSIREKVVDFKSKSGNLDAGPLDIERKSKPSSLEGRIQENQKVDESKKKRGQAQEWRLKQLSSPHSKSTDLRSRVKDHLKEKELKENTVSLAEDQSNVVLPSGVNLDSAPSSAIELSKRTLQAFPTTENISGMAPLLPDNTEDELDDGMMLGCVGFLELNDSKDLKLKNKTWHLPNSETPDRPTHRYTFDRQTRLERRDVLHRNDMAKCNRELLSIFQKLIPSEDEELRRKQLLASLDELVIKIWPEARLYLFGSCANAFGVCNSDIDVCLSIDSEGLSKSELVLQLADTLKANKMKNVQALTHARVPIVKYSDPAAGISCDVCINNKLAVVNTKLLHDYAQIDVRLRQLAFIVKHWAKCRQVNETYRGTLSSYAYVLMCIHFLQQRKPPVLPCLQEMEPTYQVTVGNITCAYYDRVSRIRNFGSRNKETLGELIVAFFDYWAFKHDYSHSVVSVRTGSFLSKIEKDWTRRIGNERHLICIEDPFEITHDLGRVVDKHSIRVLRDEFQRAARIMRNHVNPCVALFKWE